MKWSACLLFPIVCLVLALVATPANACNYGAAAVQRSYGYAYVQPAPALLPAPSYDMGGGCGCGVAAAPLPAAPAYAPSYAPSCGVGAALAPVATPYYGAGVGYSAGFAVARSRAIYAAPVRAFGVGVGYGYGGGVVAGRGAFVARGVGVGYGVGGGAVVVGRSRGVFVATPGAAVEVRRGLFGRTQIRIR